MPTTPPVSLVHYVTIPLGIGLAYAVYKNNEERSRKRAIAEAQNSDYGDDPDDQTALPPNWDPVYILTNRRATAVRLSKDLQYDQDSLIELKLRTLEANYNFQSANQFLGGDF